jgi:hypothetical protein
MSTDANKELIRRYIQAIDHNDSSDWSVIDEFVAEGVIARVLQQVGALPGPPG